MTVCVLVYCILFSSLYNKNAWFLFMPLLFLLTYFSCMWPHGCPLELCCMCWFAPQLRFIRQEARAWGVWPVQTHITFCLFVRGFCCCCCSCLCLGFGFWGQGVCILCVCICTRRGSIFRRPRFTLRLYIYPILKYVQIYKLFKWTSRFKTFTSLAVLCTPC